jgi:hypothetical protein
MSKNVRTLSTQELIDAEGGAVFVLNTSGGLRGLTGGGDVFISVEVGKSSRTLKVPRTWIPIEVTKSVPRKNLLESAYFLEAVGKGLITPIHADDALAMTRKSGYSDELRRLEEFENQVREAGKAKGIGRNVTVSGGTQDEDEERVEEVKRKRVSVVSLSRDDNDEDEKATVSVAFQAWVSKLNALGNEASARNEVRSRGELEEEEAHYMMEYIQYPKIKRSLAKALDR